VQRQVVRQLSRLSFASFGFGLKKMWAAVDKNALYTVRAQPAKLMILEEVMYCCVCQEARSLDEDGVSPSFRVLGKGRIKLIGFCTTEEMLVLPKQQQQQSRKQGISLWWSASKTKGKEELVFPRSQGQIIISQSIIKMILFLGKEEEKNPRRTALGEQTDRVWKDDPFLCVFGGCRDGRRS